MGRPWMPCIGAVVPEGREVVRVCLRRACLAGRPSFDADDHAVKEEIPVCRWREQRHTVRAIARGQLWACVRRAERSRGERRQQRHRPCQGGPRLRTRVPLPKEPIVTTLRAPLVRDVEFLTEKARVAVVLPDASSVFTAKLSF